MIGLRNSAAAYGKIARSFHWLMAALLLWQFSLALSMALLPEGDFAYRVGTWHEWTGVTLFGLVVARLIWRLLDPPPPHDVPRLMRIGAQCVHAALYVLVFVLPITGYVASYALGFPIKLYGFIPLPDPIGPNRALGFQLLAVHFWLGMALLALLGAHIGAALFHHLVLRDGTLNRMWPGRTLPRRSGGTA